MEKALLRQRHGLAAREQQLAEVLDRMVYGAEASALALRHRDTQGAFYWFYATYKDAMTGAALVRELRDGQGVVATTPIREGER